MARVTVKFGPANTIERDYNDTTELMQDDILFQFLGASRENSETFVSGAAYSGSLFENDVVVLVPKSTKKNH